MPGRRGTQTVSENPELVFSRAQAQAADALTHEARTHAVRVVAAQATGASDCREMLQMLGLLDVLVEDTAWHPSAAPMST